jgi:alkanesulfonate monooxygenase SsuD/methylene tetrahydromethanopterin reductase-like flavin-dependent oxidoreductase (luciferase family)
VTSGYAIRYADDLNYVFLPADEIAGRMASVRARCEAEGRDPASLRFSLYTSDEGMRDAGQERVDTLAGFAAVGLDRLALPDPLVADSRAQSAFAGDCQTASLPLG